MKPVLSIFSIFIFLPINCKINFEFFRDSKSTVLNFVINHNVYFAVLKTFKNHNAYFLVFHTIILFITIIYLIGLNLFNLKAKVNQLRNIFVLPFFQGPNITLRSPLYFIQVIIKHCIAGPFYRLKEIAGPLLIPTW